ncbi:MAG: hypothetical protein EP330_17875 [Deltaproteobacteria bacterium]|nr:MAG: hypothetical protein EP330_17875 [Deltaproteobacteria bacterium]
MTDGLEQRARRSRHRIRVATLAVAGILALAGATLCAVGPGRWRGEVATRFGEYRRDDVLDASTEREIGLLMTVHPSSREPDQAIVSFEYFYLGDMFVGYQRLDQRMLRGKSLGDEVDVEFNASDPGVARVVGTRLAPDAEVTRQFDRWVDATQRTAWLPALLGIALLGVAARKLHMGAPTQNRAGTGA